MNSLKNSLRGKKKVFFFMAAFFFSIIISCEQERIETPSQAKVPSSIVEKLAAAGFGTHEGLFPFRNGYIVEYDIFLTEEAINALALQDQPSEVSRSKHYRTPNLVSALHRRLFVFMDPSFNTGMQAAFDQALARYNAQVIGLSLERTTNSSIANIRVTGQSIPTQPDGSEILGVSPSFPSGGNPGANIILNTRFYNTFPVRADAITTIAHEIGHAIGFRHTDFMNRAFSCGGAPSSESSATHIPGTPTGPSANSWMLACSSNTDRPFTASDIVALRTVYPSNWTGTNAMTSTNGLLQIVQGGVLVEATTAGLWRVLGTGEWSGTTAMTSLNGFLYVVQGSVLVKANPANGAWEVLGSGDWTGTTAMTSLNGYLYIVQGGVLVKADPSNGAWEVLGTGEWSGTTAMTATNGYLYVVQGGALVKADPSNGAWEILGTGDWTGTTAMTSLNGYLYVVQGGVLVKADPSNGAWEVLGTGDWSGTTAMTALNNHLYVVQSSMLVRANPNDGSWVVL